MKKTPVQELIEELKINDVAHGMYWIKRPNEFFEKYLEKEKEQIVEASKNGISHGYTEGVVFGTNPRDYIVKWSEHYYNETYNQNK